MHSLHPITINSNYYDDLMFHYEKPCTLRDLILQPDVTHSTFTKYWPFFMNIFLPAMFETNEVGDHRHLLKHCSVIKRIFFTPPKPLLN